MNKLYVAVDIGCIECGEESACLGVFSDEDVAKAACQDHQKRQATEWHGEHYFEVFEVPAVDTVVRVDYHYQ